MAKSHHIKATRKTQHNTRYQSAAEVDADTPDTAHGSHTPQPKMKFNMPPKLISKLVIKSCSRAQNIAQHFDSFTSI
jgi:hypothetical protein